MNPATCLAARLTLHLTASSSAYIENTWSWTADHHLDGPGGNTYPGTGAGFLIEAQHGTWLLGAGVGEFFSSFHFQLDNKLISEKNTTSSTRSTSKMPKTSLLVSNKASPPTGKATAIPFLFKRPPRGHNFSLPLQIQISNGVLWTLHSVVWDFIKSYRILLISTFIAPGFGTLSRGRTALFVLVIARKMPCCMETIMKG